MAASVELLKAARAKIADPKRWTQYHSALDADGKPVMASSVGAVCWCAYGALWSLTEDRLGTPEEHLLEEACEELFSGKGPIDVNDRYGHGAVLKAYARAIAKAEVSNA